MVNDQNCIRNVQEQECSIPIKVSLAVIGSLYNIVHYDNSYSHVTIHLLVLSPLDY